VRAHDTLKAARRRETNLAAGIFLLPAFAFIAVFIAYPIYDSMRLSTMQWSGFARVEPAFVGLSNWAALMRDTVFRHAFGNNLKIVALSILIQLPIGVGLGLLLDTGGKRLNALKIAYFVPYLVSSVAVGLLFRYAFDPYFGVTKIIMGLFGRGSIDLLGHPSRAMYAVIGVICWQYTPFYMVYFLAGFSSMPTDVYEAAIIDGASRGKYFLHVALPLLKPTIKNACILSLVGSLKYFDLIYVMTGGGPVYSVGSTTYGSTELMATYMYKNAFVTNQLGYGSTVAMAMFIIVTLISSAMLFLMNRKEEIA
jgi:ABC-type sugar transport system permease subunit